MSLKKYEAFVKSAELGSLTEAAKEMDCTQSAVSHMINSLEKEFGLTLLMRGRSGASLSKDGKKLYELVRELLDKNAELQKEVATQRKVRERSLAK